MQARVAAHLHQAAGGQIDVDDEAGVSVLEVHDDGGTQRQRVQLVKGAVGVDVRRDAGARGVVLQADLVWRAAFARCGQQRLEPRGERNKGRAFVNAKGLVTESVAVVQREPALAVGPGQLVAEDLQQGGFVGGADEVALHEDAAWLDI